MYGPRSAYDSQTRADFDESIRQSDFERRLLRALTNPRVQEALRQITATETEVVKEKEEL